MTRKALMASTMLSSDFVRLTRLLQSRLLLGRLGRLLGRESAVTL